MKLSYEQMAERIDREIKDDNLKKLLFRTKHPEVDDIMGIGVMYRMATFTFLYAFSKYKFFREKSRISKFSHTNAMRVFDAFDCVYNGEDIGFDLIMYVLTEMQIDAISNDKKSFFRGIFAANENSQQIPSIRGVIKTWLHSVKLSLQDNNTLLEYFIGLYESLDILRNVQIMPMLDEDTADNIWKDKIRFTFKSLLTGDEFGSYILFFIDKEDNEFYYLSSYENTSDNNSLLSYSTLDGGNIQKITCPTITFLRTSNTTNNGALPKAIFAKSLFSIGFKYIKNLAFAVCDSITRATKQKIFEHFSRKYSDVFELGFNKKWYEVDWDNVLTILMFEEGPSNILELILDSEGIYFDKILTNLELRYNQIGFIIRIKEIYDIEQNKEMDVIRKYSDDQSTIIRNIAEVNKTLMAKCILDGLAELENNKAYSNSRFVESLPMRINSITKVTMSNEPMTAQVIKINKALEKTFRHIIPYYEGIIAFQSHKEDQIARFETSGGVLDRETLFKECEEKFFTRVREVAAKLSTASLGTLVAAFRAFGESLCERKGHRTTITPAGKALKSAIGRSYLCSARTFNNILSLKNAYHDIDSNKEHDIVSFINDIKHDKGHISCNVLLFKDFIHQVKELLYYFVYNEDYEREMIIGQQISYDPIYPYVVRYTERSENRDGYNINRFSVFFDADNGEKEVKILSDRDYEINEKYYCIPNVAMSNNRWWIEPFLISCSKYDKEINDALENAKRTIED